jgi:hypothetical protein
LLQLIIGDKGSYAYINFGALQAHEDDGRRAVKAALELREVTPLALHMGVAQGVMRVGAYGGATRQTYGALGDDVHLAAAAETLRTDVGLILQPLPRDVYEKVVATTRAVLGEEAFTAAWTEGQALTVEQAVALALAP